MSFGKYFRYEHLSFIFDVIANLHLFSWTCMVNIYEKGKIATNMIADPLGWITELSRPGFSIKT